MSNLNVFHDYNLCLSFSGLIPSPSPPVLASILSFHVLFHPHHIIVSASILLFHSRFHLPVLRFQLLFSLLTAASLSSFLSSHSYKYWHKPGDSVEVSLHPNFFCALFFCLMIFFSCLFRALVWMVVTLHLLSKSFLLGCWICYCWVI